MEKKIFKEHIENILKGEPRVWDEQEEINETKLLDLVQKYDEKIISLFLSDEQIKEKFFVKVGNAFVFKYEDFRFFMDEHKPLANSYTEYKNRIGLSDGKKFFKDCDDVVLNFPFKDCILEGGQSSEEGTEKYYESVELEVAEENKSELDGYIIAKEEVNVDTKGNKITKISGYKEQKSKRKEIFFNEILAKDEIDRLLDEKTFVNWKRYTKDGEKKVGGLKRDESGVIRENFIIKGNNLLALHSLKSEFQGKIKLIYIDPPYNTGNDSFAYNDNFNHSTWLTFMKNRLEIARELLREDGVIFVQCDDIELHYLKVLMDDIFGKYNFISTIAIKSSTPSGVKTAHKEISLIKQKDSILFYKNGGMTLKLNPQYTKRKYWDSHYNLWLDGNEKNGYKLLSLSDKLVEAGILKSGQKVEELSLSNETFRKFYLENSNSIVRLQSHKNIEADKASRKQKDKIYILKYDNDESVELFYNGQVVTRLSRGIKKVYSNQRFQNDLGLLVCDFWDDVDFQNTQNEGGVKFPTAKKPEFLIHRLIDLTTFDNDIILDYHLGSGTTSAVAHKMNRQYIGLEQMDYVENIAVERMKNVIAGEPSGISKALNWKGGGEFIYFELAKHNELAKEKISDCNSFKELISLFDELYEKYFLNYNLKIKEFKEEVITEDKFLKLSLNDQKKMFITMLDLNQMYVNKNDMNDTKFGISQEDRNLTKEFYKK
ncbi:MAG: DNA methyltransferase [Fusobacteriaceae bacterium]